MAINWRSIVRIVAFDVNEAIIPSGRNSGLHSYDVMAESYASNSADHHEFQGRASMSLFKKNDVLH